MGMRFLTALILTMLAAGASAEVYKWVDAQGKVHYGERPPVGQDATELHRASQPYTPPAEDVERARERTELLLEGQRRHREAEQEAQAREAAKAREQAQRKRRCQIARRNHRVLEVGRPVYKTNDNGERVYLEDAERQAEIARWAKQIETYCN